MSKAGEDISADSYVGVMRKIGEFFSYGEEDSEILAKFAVKRGRLAHRYLNLRWQVASFFTENRDILRNLANSIYEYEEAKQG